MILIITLDGIVILSDIYNMLADLRVDIRSQGSLLLADLKNRDTTKNVLVTCPCHAGGQEHHPSCGVSKVEVTRNGKRYPPGTVNCFTCGYKADFFEFVARCLGTLNRDTGKRYIIQKYNTMGLAQRPNIALDYARQRPGSLPYKYIDESILDNYKYTSDYLYSRKFEDDVILFYEYGLNLKNNTITMPVRDHKGGLVFVKQRFINPPPGSDKYLNETGVPKQYIIYGFYHMLQLINTINNGTCKNKQLEENYKKYGLTVTEGEFNASYLFQCGFPAISLLGRILFEDTTHRTIQQKELLLKHGIRRLTLWMDNDEPGREAQKTIINQTYKQFMLFQPDYTMFPELNDANNFSYEQIQQLQFLSV